MTTEPHLDKYKMFRNFMVNELGIGRDDIRLWTQEAITREVQKLVGQINIQSLATNAVRSAIYTTSYGNNMTENMKAVLKAAVAEEIAGRIRFTNPDSGS